MPSKEEMPACCRIAFRFLKFPLINVTLPPNSLSLASAVFRLPSSTSKPNKFRSGYLVKMKDEWPPPPTVASMNNLPVLLARLSATSSRRTGICVTPIKDQAQKQCQLSDQGQQLPSLPVHPNAPAPISLFSFPCQ